MAEPKSITIKNLLGGWPNTRLIRDKQKNVTGVRIRANYFTPKGYRLPQRLLDLLHAGRRV